MTEIVKKFSPSTLAVWRFVAKYITLDKWRTPPTLREISAACFITEASVARHLDLLQRMGKIERRSGIQRGIVLLAQPPDDDHASDR